MTIYGYSSEDEEVITLENYLEDLDSVYKTYCDSVYMFEQITATGFALLTSISMEPLGAIFTGSQNSYAAGLVKRMFYSKSEDRLHFIVEPTEYPIEVDFILLHNFSLCVYRIADIGDNSGGG